MRDSDFIGFSFNGVKSTELGIYHVSDGSRYNENLVPNLQDKTAVIEGGDGTLYWNSFYQNRQFSLQCAFDNVSEAQLRRMRQVFAAREVGQLIFDETPYKYYVAKVSGSAQIKYICFNVLNNPTDESQGTHRVYKGELTIPFVCYFPFAKSVAPYADDFDDSIYLTKDQWLEGVDLPPAADTWFDGQALSSTSAALSYGSVFSMGGTAASQSYIPVYNAGDEEMDFTCCVNISNMSSAGFIRLYEFTWHGYGMSNPINTETLTLSAVSAQSSDTWIRINSRSRLIEGGTLLSSEFVPSGNLYNKYIVSGDFFKIPVTQLGTNEKTTQSIPSDGGDGKHYAITFPSAYAENSAPPTVDYQYLFY